jgi:hypothetical protein
MITKIEAVQTIHALGETNNEQAEDWIVFLEEGLHAQYPDAEISVDLNNRQSSSTLYVECDEDEEGAPTDIDATNTVREYINYLWEQWC